MAARQRYRGYVAFSSPGAARRAYARLVDALGPGAVPRVDQFVVEEDDESGEVTVDVTAYAPASGFAATVEALAALAEESEDGGIDCILEEEQVQAFCQSFPSLEEVPLGDDELARLHPDLFHPQLSRLLAPFPANPAEERLHGLLCAACPVRSHEHLPDRLAAAARFLLRATVDAVSADVQGFRNTRRTDLVDALGLGEQLLRRAHPLFCVPGAFARLTQAVQRPRRWYQLGNPLRAEMDAVLDELSRQVETLAGRDLALFGEQWPAARALVRSTGVSNADLPLSGHDHNTIVEDPAPRCVCDLVLSGLGVRWHCGPMEVFSPVVDNSRVVPTRPIGVFAVQLAAVAGSPLMPQILLRSTAEHRQVLTGLVLPNVAERLPLWQRRGAEIALSGYTELAPVADRIRRGEAPPDALERPTLAWFENNLGHFEVA